MSCIEVSEKGTQKERVMRYLQVSVLKISCSFKSLREAIL